MDRRQEKSRQAIFHAFIALLNKTSYEKISVKDIITEANVGRSTFYDHFETKDELARSICSMLFHHIFSQHINPCDTHNFSDQPQTAENRIAHILYHFRDRRQYYLGIINYDEGNLFLRFFREFMLENMEINLAAPDNDPIYSLPPDFLVSQLAHSIVGMVRWWLRSNMQEEPEAIAAYYIAIISPYIVEFRIKENVRS